MSVDGLLLCRRVAAVAPSGGAAIKARWLVTQVNAIKKKHWKEMEHGIKTEFYDTRWLKFWDSCNKSCDSNYEMEGTAEKQNTGDIRRKWLLIWKLGIRHRSGEWEFKYLQLSLVWQSGGRGKYKDTEWRLNSRVATITTKNSLYRKYRQLWNLSCAVNEYGKNCDRPDPIISEHKLHSV